jgi:DNA-binding protein H-NS
MLNTDSAAAKNISPDKSSDSREKQVDARSSTAKKMMSAKVPRQQRISKEKPQASTNIGSDTSGPKRRGPGKKQKASAVKYRDPASDKTWSGRGRKPNWLSGDADQYLVSNLRASSAGNPDAPEAANRTETPQKT